MGAAPSDRAAVSAPPLDRPRVAAAAPHGRRVVVAASLLAGIGSLLAFFGFLLVGSLGVVDLRMGRAEALLLDGGLCCLFFVQHSGMIREWARRRVTRVVAPVLYRAVYSLASGVALLTLIVLWQPTGRLLGESGAAAWASRVAVVISIAGFVWAFRSLAPLDPFGVQVAVAKAGHDTAAVGPLRIAGAYRWVRHPLYLSGLVMIWAQPAPSADRLLFNALWTSWIVLGCFLEERDLVRDFGESYRGYQSEVPMLIPLAPPSRRLRRATADTPS
jgi:methanethiol S-methyltransferase